MSIIIFILTKDFLNTIVNTLCPQFFRRAASQRAAAKELDHINKWINLFILLIYFFSPALYVVLVKKMWYY